MTVIHKRENGIWSVLHNVKEKCPSIKDIFDNVTHYAAAGGLIILAKNMHIESRWWAYVTVGVLYGVGLTLGVICLMQSWVITQKTFYYFFPLHYQEDGIIGNLKLFVLMTIPILLLITLIGVILTLS